MNTSLPTWALKVATPEDYGIVQNAHRLGRMRIKWTDLAIIRAWAKKQGWSTPWWFGFEEKFIAKMLENKKQFEQAVNESGIEIHIPTQTYTISVEEIRRLDALYDAREDMERFGQRPTCWDRLVEVLREIRRAIEAGVVVNIEGSTEILDSWQSFYNWAHGRYHMLEDGCDHWIGDDDS